MEKKSIEWFVQRVRSKLNQHLFWSVLIRSAAVTAAVLVLFCLFFVLQGHAVPRLGYLFAGGWYVLATSWVWFVYRASQADASAFADKHFGLKDAVTSCQNFAGDGMSGGYFDLQAQQTKQRVDQLPSTKIPFAFPRRSLAVALVLGTAAGLLALKAPSQAVQDRLALQLATMEQTTIMNQQLEELVEEFQKEIRNDEEAKLIQPNKLREWVDELKETDDQKEALRQYAKLEQKLQKAADRLQQKRDEQYLERAAKELEKGEETKKLAKTLTQKKYDDAAKELSKLQPKENQPLSEQRKQLAKLKAATKRMAAAARKSGNKGQKASPKRSNSNQTAKDSSNAANKSSKVSQSKGQTGESGDSGDQSESVEQLVEELDAAVEELDQQLAKAAMQEKQTGQCDAQTLSECQNCQGKAGQCLGKLGKKLSRMGMKKGLQAKLAGLCKACSQCQSQCAGLCQASSTNPGGKEAGWGSSDTRRNETDALVDNGQYTQLKGIKGEGPSITAVEAAEDGTGISNARHTAVARSFERQMESFVEREDVPDDVKSGVRKYFEMIHQSE